MKFTNAHCAIPIILVAVTLPRSRAIFKHLKVGINMGTKRNTHSDCMVPELQLTRDLYVDYFDTTTTCLKPDGTQVYTFRNSQQSHGTGNSETVNAICFKLPKICHLLRHQRCHEDSINLCESIEDVAFPVVGRSAITNTSVTILQDYPHRVQPIFFRKCRSYKSRVVYGRCIQKYLPVSVYIASSSNDKVLAQDFVMVESGCQVIADITYREWNAKVESVQEFSVPASTENRWEKQINRTGLPSNLSHENLEPTFFVERVFGQDKSDDPIPVEDKVRISDRRLF